MFVCHVFPPGWDRDVVTKQLILTLCFFKIGALRYSRNMIEPLVNTHGNAIFISFVSLWFILPLFSNHCHVHYIQPCFLQRDLLKEPQLGFLHRNLYYFRTLIRQGTTFFGSFSHLVRKNVQMAWKFKSTPVDTPSFNVGLINPTIQGWMGVDSFGTHGGCHDVWPPKMLCDDRLWTPPGSRGWLSASLGWAHVFFFGERVMIMAMVNWVPFICRILLRTGWNIQYHPYKADVCRGWAGWGYNLMKAPCMVAFLMKHAWTETLWFPSDHPRSRRSMIPTCFNPLHGPVVPRTMGALCWTPASQSRRCWARSSYWKTRTAAADAETGRECNGCNGDLPNKSGCTTGI